MAIAPPIVAESRAAKSTGVSRPTAAGGRLPVGDRDAGAGGELHRVGVDVGHGVEATQRQHDRRAPITRPGTRHAAADETGVARLGNHVGACGRTCDQDRRHLGGRTRTHDARGRSREPAGPVGLVAATNVCVDQHVLVTDDGPQPRGERTWRHHRSVARTRLHRAVPGRSTIASGRLRGGVNMRMERFWRWLGVALGKHWKLVVAVVVLITVVLGVAGRNIEFATGQDSYLNSDSQIAIDNVAFQDDFGGETVILLFTSTDGSEVSELYEGANLAELERITEELGGVDGKYAVVTPLTSLQFSAACCRAAHRRSARGRCSRRCHRRGGCRRPSGRRLRVTRPTRQAVPDEQRVIGEPAYNQLLIYDNAGFTADGTTVTAPAVTDLRVRKSLQGTFPNVEGGAVNGTAVGGVVLEGNATLDEQTAATKQVLDVLEGARRSRDSTSPSPARRCISPTSTTTSRAACSPSALPPSS